MKNNRFQVTTFYKFRPFTTTEVKAMHQTLVNEAKACDVLGLVVLGTEGMNSTYSGTPQAAEKFKTFIKSISGFEDTVFKDSFSSRTPFRMFKVAEREEIVSIGKPELIPQGHYNQTHLSPQDWHKVLTEEKDFILIDTRNDYEYEIGTFKNAIDPKLTEFNQFPDWVKNSNIPKDKKVLMFCTGGIRCEKASIEMISQGYNNVFQLEGGILNYLKTFAEKEQESTWKGECFVFDGRVSVDHQLNPSHIYSLCPHCGDPGKESTTCLKCDSPAVVCSDCLAKDISYQTCSRNCAYHYKLNPNKKGKKQSNSWAPLYK